MTLALLDCPTGLAGNMLLGALLDLGVPASIIHGPLAALGLAGRYRLVAEQRRSGGLRGLHLAVESLENDPPHRAWGELRRKILAAPLDPPLQERVLAVFTLLAEAEAAVHGQAVEQVHFHEVGALDALVDVVGVCARGMPLASSQGFPPGELTTPTGAALAACWASEFGAHPAAVPLRIGVGLGSRRLDRPNLLRLCLAQPLQQPSQAGAGETGPGERHEPLLQQQAQIDDATAEELAFLAEELRLAGAVEVFSLPIAMKKGRLGTLVTALLPPQLAPALRQVWWRHSTSLGVRETLQRRWLLPRHQASLETPLGPLRIKWSQAPDGHWRSKAEADDLAALARRHSLGLDQVRRLVHDGLAQPPAEAEPGHGDSAGPENAGPEAPGPDEAGTRRSLP